MVLDQLSEEEDAPLPQEKTAAPRNTLNDLPGGEFLFHTRSVLTTAYPHVYSHDLRKQHGACKPPQLMVYLLETFTKAGMCVLDPFAGVGSTLIAGTTCPTGKRVVTGIDINRKWIDVYEHVRSLHSDLERDTYQTFILGDCLTLMDAYIAAGIAKYEPFDFIVFDPPYNIHLEQTMSGKVGSKYADDHVNRRTDYDMRSVDSRDLANATDFAAYLQGMEAVFARCYTLLREGRYCVFMIQNTYQNGEYSFVHVDMARAAQKAGFVPKGEIIWVPAGKRLRPYGYPTAWVPNPVHLSIVVLQKPKEKGKK